MARQQSKFNPEEYGDDFRRLQKSNPELAAQAATNVATAKKRSDNRVHRVKNQLDKASDDTKNVIAVLVASVATLAEGVFVGRQRAQRDALVAHWEAAGASTAGTTPRTAPTPWSSQQGVKDPTTIGFIPTTIAIPMIAASMAAIGKALDRPVLARAMALTTLTTGVYGIAMAIADASYQKTEQKVHNGELRIESVKALSRRAA